MAVPPLHHRIDDARVNRVRLQPVDGNGQRVNDMQDGNSDDERRIEPVRHVDMFDLAFHDRAKEDNGIRNPDDGDQQVDGPFQFGVFLARGNTERQGDGGEHKAARRLLD